MSIPIYSITHKHKLYLVSLVTSLRVQCVAYMEYMLGHEGILCDTDMSIRPFYVSEVGESDCEHAPPWNQEIVAFRSCLRARDVCHLISERRRSDTNAGWETHAIC